MGHAGDAEGKKDFNDKLIVLYLASKSNLCAQLGYQFMAFAI